MEDVADVLSNFERLGRRAADAEKPAHHLLPGADLGERPIPARIEIDLQRLRMRINRFLFHLVADVPFPAKKGEIFVSGRVAGRS